MPPNKIKPFQHGFGNKYRGGSVQMGPTKVNPVQVNEGSSADFKQEDPNQIVPNEFEQQIMQWENSSNTGYDPDTDTYHPFEHPLYKGPNGEPAYERGFGERVYDPVTPISSEGARRQVRERLVTTNEQLSTEPFYQSLPDGAKQAVLSLIDNMGYQGFKEEAPKAFAALEAGDYKTFMHEAYDPVDGIVKAGGKPHKGLINRRKVEKDWFANAINEKRQETDRFARNPKFEPDRKKA